MELVWGGGRGERQTGEATRVTGSERECERERERE